MGFVVVLSIGFDPQKPLSAPGPMSGVGRER